MNCSLEIMAITPIRNRQPKVLVIRDQMQERKNTSIIKKWFKCTKLRLREDGNRERRSKRSLSSREQRKSKKEDKLNSYNLSKFKCRFLTKVHIVLLIGQNLILLVTKINWSAIMKSSKCNQVFKLKMSVKKEICRRHRICKSMSIQTK